MIDNIHSIVQSTGLPSIFITEKQQRGDTFGERFANAFEHVFSLGYDKVLAVGNDCLTISKQDILTAANMLQTTPSVFGASTDGGAYIIGLQRNVFQKETFENIAWQTPSTFIELVQFVENQGVASAFLSPKSDIDSVFDWKKNLPTVSIFLRKKLLQLLDFGLSLPSIYAHLPINNHFLTSSFALRAPPFLNFS